MVKGSFKDTGQELNLTLNFLARQMTDSAQPIYLSYKILICFISDFASMKQNIREIASLHTGLGVISTGIPQCGTFIMWF